MHRAEDDGPTVCEQCHADAWVQRRPSPISGVMQWLGSGGPWRRARVVCGVCGASRASGGDWSMVLTGARPSRLTLPLRVVRSMVRTVQGNRHVEPVPWIYLASALFGGVVVGALCRPGHRLPAAAAGAAGGALTCWSGFASTASSTPGLADELVVAALQEVSPDRAAARRRARDVSLAETASFAVYGPVDGVGTEDFRDRWLGLAWHGRPVLVTSVVLVHGDPGSLTSPWVQVTSSVPGEWGTEWDEDTVADVLRQRLLEDDPAAVPSPPWQDADLAVDARAVPARRIRHGRHWGAIAWVDKVQVVVEAHDLPVGLRLQRMTDLSERYV